MHWAPRCLDLVGGNRGDLGGDPWKMAFYGISREIFGVMLWNLLLFCGDLLGFDRDLMDFLWDLNGDFMGPWALNDLMGMVGIQSQPPHNVD